MLLLLCNDTLPTPAGVADTLGAHSNYHDVLHDWREFACKSKLDTKNFRGESNVFDRIGIKQFSAIIMDD